MQPADLRFMVDVGEKLHAVMQQSAEAANVDYLETYAPKGHHACVAPAKRWIEGQEPGSPAMVFHPNAAGMRAQANLIRARATEVLDPSRRGRKSPTTPARWPWLRSTLVE